MTPLNRKLLRDLGRIKGQVAAIALVITAGVGVMIMSLGNIQSLRTTADAYYERYRFAEVFAEVKRAPRRLVRRIEALDNVQTVEPRITGFSILDIPGFEEPVTGLLLSLPPDGQPILNRLAVEQGRLPDPGRPDEVVVNVRFAEAQGLFLGSQFRALINAQKRHLRIVGLARSPEYIYALGPGMMMPDNERFGIIWMGDAALEGAYDLKGAFNSLSVTLLAGTDPKTLIPELDRLLEPYGGTGAYSRTDQQSNWFLMNDIDQLAVTATLLPTIFLFVAAFLTNLVIARLITQERGVIGLLKAFGYSNLEVGWHYMKMVLAIVVIGIAGGVGLGLWLGHYMTALYAEFYAFPFLIFRPSPDAFLIAAGFSVVAGVLGTLTAVRRAGRMAPAEAMRPPAPPVFTRSIIAQSRFGRFLDQPSRMIFRQILRWPVRSGLTALGVAFAIGVLVNAFQWLDATDYMMEMDFRSPQRQSASVSLAEVRPESVLHDFSRLSGVQAVEGERAVSARARFGPKARRIAVIGVPPQRTLSLILDADGNPVPVFPGGLTVSTKLADLLGADIGDLIRLEILEGRRPSVDVPIVTTFETRIGYPAYMNDQALNRLLKESSGVTTVHLLVDQGEAAPLYADLKELPQVAFVNVPAAAVTAFQDTIAETLLIFTGIFTVFSMALAVGVTYNASRIALSENARELATLRLIGFTRFEVSYILFGQILLLTAAALPVGCVLGYLITIGMVSAFDTELYRMPAVIEPSSYGYSVLVAVGATLASSLLVWRRLHSLDLIAVLKTRE